MTTYLRSISMTKHKPAKALPRKSPEQLFQDHIRREGRGVSNENPDGCYYCGSLSHHSDGCLERELGEES